MSGLPAEPGQRLTHKLGVAGCEERPDVCCKQGTCSGFLRCGCGYAKLLKNPHDDHQERTRPHRTPFNLQCERPFWHPHEDLAHEFRTDVLQVRLDHSLPVPKDLPLDELDDWLERFTRTLAEAVRRGGSDLLGIEPRELAVTVRTRLFGYPEVILTTL